MQRKKKEEKVSSEGDGKHHDKVLASAAVSTSYNMIYGLSFRLLTFVLNAVNLRYITRDMLGVVNVRLLLLYYTTLFVAREAFRKACLSKTKENPWIQVINLLWCTFPVAIVTACIFTVIWMYLLEQPDDVRVPYYHCAVVIFALSTLVEMLAEPLYMASQILLYARLGVIISGVSLALKSILSVFLIIAFPNWGLIAFSIAQLCYSCIYTLLYYIYFTREIVKQKANQDFPFKSISDVFPKTLRGVAWIDWELANLTWSFFKQSFLKQILTDGERYVMTIFAVLSFGDQGVYDVINNLGSLAAKFIFLPLEEGAYLLFSQTLERGRLAKEQPKSALDMATSVLESLLKGLVLIGLTILVFGYAYSYSLLDIYGGSLLSSGSGPLLLRTYCFYVLIIAVNGVSEGFVFAAMSKQQVDLYNHKMLGFSAIFLFSAYYLAKYFGSVGFIFANCLNMLARTIHSIYFIIGYYQDTNYTPLKGLLPSPFVIAALAVSFIVTFLSERTFCCQYGILWQGLHILIGGSCLLLVMLVIYLSEKRLVTFIKEQYKKYKKCKVL